MRTPWKAFESTTVLKALAAVSGGFMAGWALLHVLGNFTAFAGRPSMDGYAAGLRRLGPLLWGLRAALAAALVVHLLATVALARRARAARPGRAVRRWPRGSVASRTAFAGGPLLLAFIAYHLLHMTFGVVHPAFEPGHVYANLVGGLREPIIALVYVVAAALVGLHLHRGLSSALASLGVTRATKTVPRAVAATLAVVIAAGFAAIPIAVLSGVVR
ncbi:MAG TPA: hypothetical protein VHU80_12645 [Polyangiaceae bacterium]|jgi:succinate dehydrogenase / fumarate reductase cytochrome b subunit|nr:hypothetical protein [Polyangiaceae bacterium]